MSSPPAPSPIRTTLLYALALFYFGAGVLHLRSPDPFLLIMPDWAPYPRQIIQATGVCEIAGAVGLLFERTRKAAGVALALYAVCVFPANIKHAFENIAVPGLPQTWWYHGPRLVLQPVLVWLALYASRVVDWPFGRSRSSNESR